MSRAAWLIIGGVAALATSWAANYFQTPVSEKDILETLARSREDWWSLRDIPFFAGAFLSYLPLIGLLCLLFGITSWLFAKSARHSSDQLKAPPGADEHFRQN
jgi:hypothetical protein